MSKNAQGPGGRTKNPGAAKPAAKPPAASRKFAERQAAKQRAALAQRQRRNRLLGIGSIVMALVIVVVLVAVKVTAGGGTPTAAAAASVSPAVGTPVPASLTTKLASVPLSALVAAPSSGVTTSPQAISDPMLKVDGKPDLLFIGAEFCPICATERWAMYVALSKFGSFSPQPGQIHSAVRDGDISTLTFYKTTYTSPYLSFTPVETTTNQPDGDYYVTLQTPTSAQEKLWASHTDQSFPWLDFGGKMELTSAQYDPSTLEGQSFDNIASAVGNNSTTIGADIDASAKVLIKTICATMTGGQPADVCHAVGSG